MSLGKRQAEEAAERELRKEKETCGCKWNYDDKFEILCGKHQEEADEANWCGG